MSGAVAQLVTLDGEEGIDNELWGGWPPAGFAFGNFPGAPCSAIHAIMPHEMEMEDVMHVKTVGKSGQISLGKALAGSGFIVETLPSGDIMLRRAVVVPLNERWVHEPAMRRKLAKADAWAQANAPEETDLDQLAAQYSR